MGHDVLFSKVPIALLEDPEADAYTVAVYAALRSKCDFGKETGATVSDAAAAELAGCSPRTFQDRRMRLRDRGWVDWKQRFGAKNRYTVRDEPRRKMPGSGSEATARAAEVEDETAATDAGVDGATAAGDAEGAATDAGVPRREMPTTENPYREPPRESARGGQGKATAEEDWRLVRQKMDDRRATIMADLTDRGKAALKSIGGIEALSDCRPADVRHLRRDFLDAHRNGRPRKGDG